MLVPKSEPSPNLPDFLQQDFIDEQDPADDLAELSFSAEDVSEASKKSLDFLAALAMPTVFRYFFPPIYIAVWEWLLETVHKTRDFSQLALGLPRGFAKSTVIKLFVLYCVLFTSRKFILVTSENQSKANNIISDVIDMLNEPNIIAAFGDWKLGIESDRLDLKKFGFRGRNITIMAGTVSAVRGINLKNERPDIMIFDDIQSRECSESQVQSETLEREMIGTAMKAKSPHGCMFLFVGNMYPTKFSILKKLKTNPNWVKFIVGGILASGESLWEELQPLEQLIKEFQNDLSMGKPQVFYAEVLNDENAALNNLVDLSNLPALPYHEGDIPNGNFIVIDPAGSKKKSNNTAIGYFEVYDAKPVLVDLVNEILSPGRTVYEALRLCLTYNCRLVAVESVAYQASLCYWAQHIMEQRQINGIEFVEVYPDGGAKNSRILKMLREYVAGEVFVKPNLQAEVHLEMMQFNPLKTDNTDNILDVLTYPYKIIREFGEFITSTTVIEMQDFDATEVPEFNSPF
jgi:hypothetical protein